MMQGALFLMCTGEYEAKSSLLLDFAGPRIE